MTAAILYVVTVFGAAPPLHYADMATCQREARLIAEDRENVISAVCKPALHIVKGAYVPPKP